MSSWRDSASQQAQHDLDVLLDVTLAYAQEMLGKSDAFYPFGATVTADGETCVLTSDPGREHPSSADVLSGLLAQFLRDRADLRAVAICSDVRLLDQDAVRAELEHQDGHAIAVLMPFKRLGWGDVDYGDLQGIPAVRQVWALSIRSCGQPGQ